jgi:4a-hydroxytetrahydrobiopterin dehydratase
VLCRQILQIPSNREARKTMPLASKSCVPCHGGIPPISRAQAEGYLKQIPGWTLTEDAQRIEREFKFKDFAAALAFVNQVGAVAEAENHHPDLHFGWGYCKVILWTHKIHGLHENDFIMAAKISELAGEAPPPN